MKRVFGIIIWLAMTAWGVSSIGIVEQYRGSVHVVRGTRSLSIQKNFKLQKKDILRTGNNGWVKIKLSDNTRITAGKNAKLILQDYLYDKSSKSKVSLGFSKGVFQAISGAIGKVARKNFKVHTPTATIGIRGTEFYVRVSAKREQVLCTRGAIVFNNGAREIVVEAGHQILADLISQRLEAGKITAKDFGKLQKTLIRSSKSPAHKKPTGLLQRSKRGVLTKKTTTSSSPKARKTNPNRHFDRKKRTEELIHEQITSVKIDKTKPVVQHPCENMTP